MYGIEKVDYGIHTIELSVVKLKYSQVQKVIDNLAATGNIRILSRDADNLRRSMFSNTFQAIGISAIRTYQSANASNGISIQLNPASVVSGHIEPITLYRPTKSGCDTIITTLRALFKEIELETLFDSVVNTERLTLSQADITANLWFDEGTDLDILIYLLKHANAPNGLKRNKHNPGFVLNSGITTFKCYDKGRELSDRGHLPSELAESRILRLELSLKRDRLVKGLGVDRNADLHTALSTVYRHGKEMVTEYLGGLFPAGGDHLRYDEAKRMIERMVNREPMRGRMLYMLKKTATTDGLDKAIKAMEKELAPVQIQRMFQKFDELGVNPVTLPRKSRVERLLSIPRMVDLPGRTDEKGYTIEFYRALDDKLRQMGQGLDGKR